MRSAFGAVSLVALGIIAAAASPARADDPGNRWSGFYLGIAAGFADVDNDVRLSANSVENTWNRCLTTLNDAGDNDALEPVQTSCQDAPAPRSANNDIFDPGLVGPGDVGVLSNVFNPASSILSQLNTFTSGDVSALGAVIVGVDQKIAPSVVVGAFADLSVLGDESGFSATGPIANISGKLDFDYLATVGGRLGVIVPKGNALLYVYGGYTYADAGDSGATVTTGQGSTTVGFDDFHGFSVGGGGEAQLGGGWFARLEYRYTGLNAQKFGFSHVGPEIVTAEQTPTGHDFFAACTGAPGNGPPSNLDCQRLKFSQTTTSGSAEVDPDIHSVRMALGYRF